MVQPRVLVLLGATAAQALLGSSFRVSRQRGEFRLRPRPRVLATVHPSSILRAPDEEARALAYKGFVADLAVVAEGFAARLPSSIARRSEGEGGRWSPRS